eukprot:1141029-Rhodomonas_salina.1
MALRPVDLGQRLSGAPAFCRGFKLNSTAFSSLHPQAPPSTLLVLRVFRSKRRRRPDYSG